MARRRKQKPNIALCAAFVLLCLTMITTHLTSGLYARYVTSDSAQDLARVVKFGNVELVENGDFVDEYGNLKPAVILPGVNLEKDINVNVTKSEVDNYVIMGVELNGNWSVNDSSNPTKFFLGTQVEWSIHSDWEYSGKVGNVYLYSIYLNAGDELNVDFIADLDPTRRGKVDTNVGGIKIDSSITKNDLLTMQNLSIKLTAAIVQTNGSKTVVEAWESVVK